jgi:hypothetical protein
MGFDGVGLGRTPVTGGQEKHTQEYFLSEFIHFFLLVVRKSSRPMPIGKSRKQDQRFKFCGKEYAPREANIIAGAQ